jgi:hypothetical protein
MIQHALHETKHLESSLFSSTAVDLNELHGIAKNLIFMLESLDAALRALDAAIASHCETRHACSEMWRATHSSLLYRRELFHATRLRILSVDNRVKNIINLVSPSSER